MARSETIVGLDIGKSAVKAAWVRMKGEALSVERTEILHLPPDGANPRALLLPWLGKMGLGKCPCVLGLSGQQTMFQPFILPPGDPRTPEQAAAIEVLRFNEMANETMLYDFTPFSFNPGERRLLVAMARPSVVNELISTAREAGLNVANVVPAPLACFNALELAGGPHDEPHIYVNVGHATTEVAIGSWLGLFFARSFSSGGRAFTDALAKAGGMPLSRAEELKISEGFIPDGTDAQANTPLAQVADQWMSELMSCLSVYRSLFSERKAQPARIVLAGGAVRLRGFSEFVERRAKLPATLAGALPGGRGGDDAPQFAVAVGLGLAGLKRTQVALSLLPQRMRDDLVFRRQKPYWIGSGVAAALILAVSVAGGYRDNLRSERELSAQRSSLARRTQLVQQIEGVKAAAQQMRRMAVPIRDLLGAAPTLEKLISVAATAKDKGDQITMICDADTYFGTHPLAPVDDARSGGATAAAGSAERRRPVKRTPDDEVYTNRVMERVMIEGITRKPNLSSVKELIAALTSSGFVQSADLLSDDKLVLPPDSAKSRPEGLFVIEVKLAKP